MMSSRSNAGCQVTYEQLIWLGVRPKNQISALMHQTLQRSFTNTSALFKSCSDDSKQQQHTAAGFIN